MSLPENRNAGNWRIQIQQIPVAYLSRALDQLEQIASTLDRHPHCACPWDANYEDCPRSGDNWHQAHASINDAWNAVANLYLEMGGKFDGCGLGPAREDS